MKEQLNDFLDTYEKQKKYLDKNNNYKDGKNFIDWYINESGNLRLFGVGFSWPTKEDITSKLKECDKDLKLSENINEKQAFNHGFRVSYRWLKNKMT